MIPDVVEPIAGWRMFCYEFNRHGDYVLVSPHQGTVWKPGRDQRAHCRVGGLPCDLRAPKCRDHGIHTFGTKRQAIDYVRLTNQAWGYRAAGLAAKVLLWGTCVKRAGYPRDDSWGWTGEHARIVGLHHVLPGFDHVARYAGERYGVPVTGLPRMVSA